MSRVSFLNGQLLPHDQCLVHIEDRGFQFADGVYEVILLKNNRLIDIDWHLDRLFHSLGELQIKFDQNHDQLKKIILDLFSQNNLSDGSVYLQITRGFASRQQAFPPNYTPTISITVSPLKAIDPQSFDDGLSVITHEDIRWKRCNIKSIGLIAQSFIKQKAFEAGADDAIMIRDGYITEATFANVFMIDATGNLITKNADNLILCGITRNRIIQLAQQNNIVVLEKQFTLAELLLAGEVFLSSTTLLVRPVSKIDGNVIGSGKAGKISKKLLGLYNQFITNQ